jgi:hypothetical protein
MQIKNYTGETTNSSTNFGGKTSWGEASRRPEKE